MTRSAGGQCKPNVLLLLKDASALPDLLSAGQTKRDFFLLLKREREGVTMNCATSTKNVGEIARNG